MGCVSFRLGQSGRTRCDNDRAISQEPRKTQHNTTFSMRRSRTRCGSMSRSDEEQRQLLRGSDSSIHRSDSERIHLLHHNKQSQLESKNFFSNTWHTRTFKLVQAPSRTFLLRFDGQQLRGVSAVTPQTKVEKINERELLITSLEPNWTYHLRATNGDERDSWVERLQTAVVDDNTIVTHPFFELQSKDPFTRTWHSTLFDPWQCGPSLAT